MKKLKSIGKKLANLNVPGYIEGRKSLKKGDKEELAKKRAKICAECPNNELEPIEELRVKDSISEISERFCSECGCSLPILLRQNKKHCSLGKW